MSKYTVRFVSSIAAIGRDDWQRIAGRDYPFSRYDFLHALETAGERDPQTGQLDAACTRLSGWMPDHALVSDAFGAIAVMPLYLKYHSYGEYIFDWAWAEAYQRNGLDYYPKLLAAIPYSPVTGPRLAIDEAALSNGRVQQQELIVTLTQAVKKHCREVGASSFHLLYPDQQTSRAMAAQEFTTRHSFQYHWFNGGPVGDSGDGIKQGEKFADFAAFCATLKSRKRKAILKERREIAQQDICIERLAGEQITDDIWHRFYQFYQLTYAKRSGHGGYLNEAFFRQIGRTMPEQIMLVVAKKQGVIIAGALNLFSSTTLYGRYWGCTQEAEFLHFEACYYQGIEFCIERGLRRFDAGAQGEHKIQRGFRPVDTWSNHWIADQNLSDAVGDFTRREELHNEEYRQAARGMLPFK